MQLIHELWVYVEDGMELCLFCLAGPRGSEARETLPPDAKLVWTVEAGSHYEAMTRYYERQGRGKYTTEFAQDYEPYPAEWAEEQQAFMRERHR